MFFKLIMIAMLVSTTGGKGGRLETREVGVFKSKAACEQSAKVLRITELINPTGKRLYAPGNLVIRAYCVPIKTWGSDGYSR